MRNRNLELKFRRAIQKSNSTFIQTPSEGIMENFSEPSQFLHPSITRPDFETGMETSTTMSEQDPGVEMEMKLELEPDSNQNEFNQFQIRKRRSEDSDIEMEYYFSPSPKKQRSILNWSTPISQTPFCQGQLSEAHSLQHSSSRKIDRADHLAGMVSLPIRTHNILGAGNDTSETFESNTMEMPISSQAQLFAEPELSENRYRRSARIIEANRSTRKVPKTTTATDPNSVRSKDPFYYSRTIGDGLPEYWQTFPCFPLLPDEIQLMIFNYMLPSPQEILLRKTAEEVGAEPDPSSRPNLHICRYKYPILLQINFKSREFFLQKYEMVTIPSSSPMRTRCLFVDWTIDRVEIVCKNPHFLSTLGDIRDVHVRRGFRVYDHGPENDAWRAVNRRTTKEMVRAMGARYVKEWFYEGKVDGEGGGWMGCGVVSVGGEGRVGKGRSYLVGGDNTPMFEELPDSEDGDGDGGD